MQLILAIISAAVYGIQCVKIDVTPVLVDTPEKFYETSSIYWDYRTKLLNYIAPSERMIVTLNLEINEQHSVEINCTPVFVLPSDDPECVVVGCYDSIITVKWDGISDSVQNVETIGTIDDGIILGGAVTSHGYITFIVEGMEDDGNKIYSIYGMKIGQEMLKLTDGENLKQIEDLAFNCSDAWASGSKSGVIYKGTITGSKISLPQNDLLNSIYSPRGFAMDIENQAFWHVVNYVNHDPAEIWRTIGVSIDEWFTFPKRRGTSLTFGGENFDILFFTTKDTDDDGGGIYKIEGLNHTGRPAYMALSRNSPAVDYCIDPMPKTITASTTTTTEATDQENDNLCNCFSTWWNWKIYAETSNTGQVPVTPSPSSERYQFFQKFCTIYSSDFYSFVNNYQSYVPQNYGNNYNQYAGGSSTGNQMNYRNNFNQIMNCIPNISTWNNQYNQYMNYG